MRRFSTTDASLFQARFKLILLLRSFQERGYHAFCVSFTPDVGRSAISYLSN